MKLFNPGTEMGNQALRDPASEGGKKNRKQFLQKKRSGGEEQQEIFSLDIEVFNEKPTRPKGKTVSMRKESRRGKKERSPEMKVTREKRKKGGDFEEKKRI